MRRGRLLRRSLIAAFACFVFGGVCFWVIVLEPIHRYNQCNRRIRATFESLKPRRPDNLTRRQWAGVVGWTMNAGSNCLGYDLHWPNDSTGFTDALNKLEQFEKELNHRFAGPVDIETIDWIWDELARITKYGKRYSDNYRPTLPERLEEFAAGNPWAGIEVD